MQFDPLGKVLLRHSAFEAELPDYLSKLHLWVGRLGFAAAGDNFSKALDRFGAFVKSWSAKMVTA